MPSGSRAAPTPGNDEGGRSRPLLSVRWRLVSLLVVLSGLDFVLTRLLLERGATELNPLMSPLVGSMWGWAAKTVGVGLVALAILHTREDGKVERGLRLVLAVYAVVVVWNLIQLLARS